MARERRSYPRYPVSCPVEVTLPEADSSEDRSAVHQAICNNLSRSSIQIECRAEMVAALLRQQKLPYACTLRFTLPWCDHPFHIDAQVVTHRRMSQFQYVLVLLLRHADPAGEEQLEQQLAARNLPGLS